MDSPAPTPVPAPAPRLTYLDGIRALAALYVVAHHIWLTIWPEYLTRSGPLGFRWLAFGQVAVAVFIVVSGFSLALGPVRAREQLVGGPRRFFRRRAWRILPPYWAALVVSCLVIVAYTGGQSHGLEVVTAKGVVVHAFLLQDIIGSASPNGAFWSIAIEWQIYFIFPILLWWWRRYDLRSMVIVTCTIAVAAYLASMSPDSPFHAIERLFPQFVILFVFGMAAASVVSSDAGRRNGAPWCRIAGLGALVLAGYAAIAGIPAVVEHYFWIDIAAGTCATLLIVGLADGRARRLRNVLGGKVLHTVGGFSFSIYLIHLPVVGIVWYSLVKPMDLSPVGSLLTLLAIGIPAVLVVAYGFSAVFEQPFVRCRSLADLRAYVGGAVGRHSGSPST